MREQILGKARELGASLAGIAGAGELKQSPSHTIFGKLEKYTGVGTKPQHSQGGTPFQWPADARSVLVIALEHPEDQPELDWWRKDLTGGTPGNRTLMAISRTLAEWLRNELGIQARGLPYHIEEGGIFLKDAAVLAGLGCIGRNNLLITPSLGPRVRLRAMFLDRDLPFTGAGGIRSLPWLPEALSGGLPAGSVRRPDLRRGPFRPQPAARQGRLLQPKALQRADGRRRPQGGSGGGVWGNAVRALLPGLRIRLPGRKRHGLRGLGAGFTETAGPIVTLQRVDHSGV